MGKIFSVPITESQQENKAMNAELQNRINAVNADLEQEVINRKNDTNALNLRIDDFHIEFESQTTIFEIEDNFLQAEIDSETAMREATDERLDAEIQNRLDSEDKMRDDYVSRVESETTMRMTADANLDQKFTTAVLLEKQTRESADNSLWQDIQNEGTARANADNVLDAAIVTEITARAAGDANVLAAVTKEAQDRDDAINAAKSQLQTAIHGESTARQQAVQTLQTNINNVQNTLTDFKVATASSDSERGLVPKSSKRTVQIFTNLGWRDPDDTTLTIAVVPTQAGSLSYTGSLQSPSWANYDSNKLRMTGTTSATAAGTHTVTVKPLDLYVWADTLDQREKTTTWKIDVKKLAKPTAATTEFSYTGNPKTLNVSNYDSDFMTQEGTITASDVGSYSVTYKLKNKTSSKWADNSTADVTITWSIGSMELTEAQSTFSQEGTLTYNGNTQTVTIKNYNSTYHVLGGTTSSSNAGTFTATVAPAGSYTWSDGTTTPKSVSWTIQPKKITKPTAAKTSFEYDGTAKNLTVSNYDPTYMTQSGTISETNSGSYSVTYALKSKTNTTWADNSTANVVISWGIGAGLIDIPTAETTTFTYSGSAKTLSVTGYNAQYMTQSGTLSATDAGTYTATYTLNDKTKTKWADNTTTDKSITWIIERKKLTDAQSTFAQDGTLTYNGTNNTNGTLQAATINNYDSSIHTLGGTTSAKNAGTYTATVTPQANYCWNDGTFAAKDVSWVIGKKIYANPTFSDGTTETSMAFAASGTVTSANVKFIPQLAFLISTITDETNKTYVYSQSGGSAGEFGAFTVQGVNVGAHTFTIKLASNFAWANGTDTAELTLIIQKRVIAATYSEQTIAAKTYNGEEQTVSPKSLSGYTQTGGTLSATAVGTYEATLSLLYPNGTEWSDGTTDTKVFSWSINPISVNQPYAAETNFVYDGTAKTLELTGYNESYMTQTGTTSASNFGTYTATFHLTSANYCWADGSTEDFTIEWSIGMTQVETPYLSDADFTYDGDTKSPTINYDSSNVTISGTQSATNAGTYTITATLKDATTTVWQDGSTSPLELKWEIDRQKLSATQSNFGKYFFASTYDGTTQDIPVTNYDANVHTLGGTIAAKNAGTYRASVSPKPNYCWNGGGTVAKPLTWTILPLYLVIPTIPSTQYEFNAEIISPEVSNFNATYMTKTTSGKSASNSFTTPNNYSITIALKDKENTRWETGEGAGSTEDIVLNYNVTKATVPAPTLDNYSFVYDGTEKTVNASYDSKWWEFNTNSSSIKGTDAEKTMVRFNERKINNEYIWAYINVEFDENALKTGSSYKEGFWLDLIWEIKPVALSEELSTLGNPSDRTYNGNNQSPPVSGFNSTYHAFFSKANGTTALNVTGTPAGKNVGTYTTYIRPKESPTGIASTNIYYSNYTWADGTTTAKKVTWNMKPLYLPKPYLSGYTNSSKIYFTFDGQNHSVNIVNYNETWMNGAAQITLSGSTAAGTPTTLTISLKDKTNTKWEDGTTDDITFELEFTTAALTEAQSDFGEPIYSTTTGKTLASVLTNYDSSKHVLSSNVTASSYGTYTATITPAANYTWNDNTTTSKNITWYVVKKLVDKPTLNQISYNYTGSNVTADVANYNSTYMTRSGEYQASETGTHNITYTLNENYLWADKSTAAVVLTWSIGDKTYLKKPTAKSATSFTYSGSTKNFIVNNYNSTYMTQSGDVSAINVGTYTATYSLKNKTTTAWADGTTTDVKLTWTITRKKLTAAQSKFSPDTLTFDGSSKSVTIVGYDPTYHTLGGTYTATHAGTYTATVTPKANYSWSDGTYAAKNVSWKINKKLVAKPTLSSSDELTYNRAAQGITVNYDTSEVVLSAGQISATKAGTYTATYALKHINDNDAYKGDVAWADNSTDSVAIEWVINKKKIAVPVLLGSDTFAYNGKSQTAQIQVDNTDSVLHSYQLKSDGTKYNYTRITSSDSAIRHLSGTIPGTYSLVFYLANTASSQVSDAPNYEWDDATAGDYITFSITITKKTLTADYETLQQTIFPARQYDSEKYSNKVWNVTDCGLTPTDYDTYLTLGGTSTAANAGTYTATATPKSDYATWANGTTGVKNFSWSITKSVTSFTPAVSSVTFNDTNLTAAIYVQYNYNGTVDNPAMKTNFANNFFAETLNADVVTVASWTNEATVPGQYERLKLVLAANGNGSTRIKISAKELDQFRAPADVYIDVTVSRTLESLTWEQIQTYTLNGTLLNYTQVGDSKSVSLSGDVYQTRISGTYCAVLMDYRDNTATFCFGKNSDKKDIAFVDSYYGTKVTDNSVAAFKHRTYDVDYTTTWAKSDWMHRICTAFFGMLPSEISSVIKQVTKSKYRSKIWIMSEYEVSGKNEKGIIESSDQNQFAYYKNGNSKMRYRHDSPATRASWWTRTTTRSDDYSNCYVRFYDSQSGLSVANGNSAASYGFVPCFTIG